ncbi:hypothetical protein Tco_0875128 [Tanacetum coccineum]|uniref:Uncharacterized protein n=1 Tax=Tanacetum coccineum TaxID=301880 RepID=A0ABQ5BRL5_9ASTR
MVQLTNILSAVRAEHLGALESIDPSKQIAIIKHYLYILGHLGSIDPRICISWKLSSSALEMLVPGHAVANVMGRGRANVDNIRKYDQDYFPGKRKRGKDYKEGMLAADQPRAPKGLWPSGTHVEVMCPVVGSSLAMWLCRILYDIRYQTSWHGVLYKGLLKPLLHQHSRRREVPCFLVRTGNTYLGHYDDYVGNFSGIVGVVTRLSEVIQHLLEVKYTCNKCTSLLASFLQKLSTAEVVGLEQEVAATVESMEKAARYTSNKYVEAALNSATVVLPYLVPVSCFSSLYLYDITLMLPI